MAIASAGVSQGGPCASTMMSTPADRLAHAATLATVPATPPALIAV